MIIVAGHLTVRNRDTFLENSKPAVIAARKNPACLDFSVTADLLEKDHVCIFERWKDQDSLEKFREDGPGEDLSSLIISAKINEFAAEPL